MDVDYKLIDEISKDLAEGKIEQALHRVDDNEKRKRIVLKYLLETNASQKVSEHPDPKVRYGGMHLI